MRKNGRTLSEDIRLIRRGMKEFNVFLPGQLRLLFIRSAVTMIISYIGILMASAVISELDSLRRSWFLAAIVICATVTTLILSIIAALVGRSINVGYSQLFPAHEIRLNEKANAMKYSFIEDEKIRALRDQVSGSIDCSGAGMGSLYWDSESIFKALISALISTGILIFSAAGNRAAVGQASGIMRLAASAWGYLILAGFIIVSVIVSSKATSRIFDVSFDVFRHGAEYNRYANYYKLEYLSDDRTAQDVRLYSQKDLILREVLDKCYVPFVAGDRREKAASSINHSVMLILSALTGGMVYILVGARAMAGAIGIGNVLLVYSAVAMLIKALTDISMTFTDLRNNNEHLIRYFDYISLEEERADPRPAAAKAENAEVRIDRVSFRYPGSENYALRDISLTIRAGEKIAIVGENGSGKTTLVKLICGLYDADEGEISVGGYSVSGADRIAGADMLSVVFQDLGLLALPIGNNIAAGGHYDEARVWDALDKVGLKEKVMSLPMKLEQPLFKDYDENGVELSGGEEQKIAIARGIYRDAPLFILDEPTAALDPFSEYEIFTKMNEIARNKTTIFISHRLYSCRFCDRIAVMDGGRIVQTGTHDELVSAPGKYSELWNAQAKHYNG